MSLLPSINPSSISSANLREIAGEGKTQQALQGQPRDSVETSGSTLEKVKSFLSNPRVHAFGELALAGAAGAFLGPPGFLLAVAAGGIKGYLGAASEGKNFMDSVGSGVAEGLIVTGLSAGVGQVVSNALTPEVGRLVAGVGGTVAGMAAVMAAATIVWGVTKIAGEPPS
ncbi:MAG: hypothetical protein HYU64_00505 [Armatimonadetes bacterium]|nr:hypothetical protein [Armatimonadota bacterium]